MQYILTKKIFYKWQESYVFCPYVPLNVTSSFTSYTGNGFGLSSQKYLANLADTLFEKKYKIFISNHNTDLTQSLYKKSKIKDFEVRRMIGANSTSRGNVSEIVACYE